MSDLLAQYGPLGAVVVILAGVVSQLVRSRRNSNGHEERRVSMLELREDVKEIRHCIHDMRDRVLTPLCIQVAELRRDIEYLKERLPER